MENQKQPQNVSVDNSQHNRGTNEFCFDFLFGYDSFEEFVADFESRLGYQIICEL